MHPVKMHLVKYFFIYVSATHSQLLKAATQGCGLKTRDPISKFYLLKFLFINLLIKSINYQFLFLLIISVSINY